jgi:alpha-1,2-mannosyltransferase
MFQMYRLVLDLPAAILCNSSWTANHLKSVLDSEHSITTLYPPCDFPRTLCREKDPRLVVSLAQFRPEKRHDQQLLVFQKVLQRVSAARLTLIGGCRNEEDWARVRLLKEEAHRLGFPPGSLTFAVNEPVETVRDILAEASIGMHTMQEEHFGISVVEMMAAGVVVVAHSSGGPLDDIINHNESKKENSHRGILPVC